MFDRRAALVLSSAMLAATGRAAAQDDQPGDGDGGSNVALSGYDKLLLVASRTLDGDDRPYRLVLNRTRLKLEVRVRDWLGVRVEDDTEVRAGDYLRSRQFAAERTAPRRQYWNGQSTWVDDADLRVDNRLYRAYARISFGNNDTTIGRQRIPLGTGRMWSTLDMLNPVNPLQIERDEYVGVDAIQSEQKLDAASRLVGVYAPDPARRHGRWIAQYRTHRLGSDLTFTAGRYGRDRLAGVDVATQVGEAGLRGELTWTRPPAGPGYAKALIGLDYAFANTFTVSLEAYHSRQAQDERLRQFADDPQRMSVEPYGGSYLGANCSYEFTPLLKASAYLLGNLQDGSRFYSPNLSYSLANDLVVQAGIQIFKGGNNTDYGRGKNLFYVQTQLFF
jgi:hypothetical protein